METFTCFDCGNEKQTQKEGGTGYAVLPDGNKICYDCCAERDKEYMRDHDKNTLYLSMNENKQYEVTNWPGTLKFFVTYSEIGRHNIARTQTHVYFKFEGQRWYGVQTGENTQICRCKRLK